MFITKYKYLLKLIIMIILTIRIEFGKTFQINNVLLDETEDGFRVSLENEIGIQYVVFNINVNHEFKAYETGQYSGVGVLKNHSKQLNEDDNNYYIVQQSNGVNEDSKRLGVWTFDVKRTLKRDDVIYVWLAVQHHHKIHRNSLDPIKLNMLDERNGSPSKPLNSSDCKLSISEMLRTTEKLCAGQLIFEDNFDRFESKHWTEEIRIPLSQYDAEFVLYNSSTEVSNSHLKIQAYPYGDDIRSGSLDLGARCTGNYIEKECRLSAHSFIVLPPVVSGRVNTRYKFVFKYGRIEVRARLPIGDWLYPLILLEPNNLKYGVTDYDSGEMRVAFVRGNEALQSSMQNSIAIGGGNRLYGGAILSTNSDLRHRSMVSIDINRLKGGRDHFGKMFHVYGLTWTPEELILTVDGHEYGRVPCDFKAIYNKARWQKADADAPLGEFFYITLGLAAGGHGDFPNHIQKPWINTSPKAALNFWLHRQEWFPTWSQPNMLVDYVRVYAV